MDADGAAHAMATDDGVDLLAVAGPESSARVFIPGRRLLTIGMVSLITIAASEALAVATVMPLVERELGDLALYGWVLSAFMLGNLTGIVLTGRLADRVPLAPILAGGLTLFVVGLALGSAAPSMVVLVAARALQGVGAGAIPAVATVCVARAYVPAARPRMFALTSTAWIAPALFGPAIASRVATALSWRWVFGGLIPMAIGAGIVTLIALHSLALPVARDDASHPHVAVTLALVGGVGLLLGGIAAEQHVLGGGVAIAGAVAAAWALLRLLPEGTFRFRPGLPATVAAKGVFTYAFFAADFFMPLALTNVRGVSAEYASLVVTTVSLSWAVTAWVQERWIRRVGPRPLVVIGFVLVAVGSTFMAVIVASELPTMLAFAAGMLSGFGAGLLFAPLSAAGLAAARRGEEGRATSALLLTETLGIALGTGVAGAIVAVVEQQGQTLQAGVVCVFLLSALIALAGTAAAPRIPASVLTSEP